MSRPFTEEEVTELRAVPETSEDLTPPVYIVQVTVQKYGGALDIVDIEHTAPDLATARRLARAVNALHMRYTYATVVLGC